MVSMVDFVIFHTYFTSRRGRYTAYASCARDINLIEHATFIVLRLS